MIQIFGLQRRKGKEGKYFAKEKYLVCKEGEKQKGKYFGRNIWLAEKKKNGEDKEKEEHLL